MSVKRGNEWMNAPGASRMVGGGDDGREGEGGQDGEDPRIGGVTRAVVGVEQGEGSG